MRKPEQTSEPSIEEILASIRRIIADDGAQSKSAAGELAEAPSRRVQETEDYAAEDYWARGVSRQLADPAEDAGILELTEDFMIEERSADRADQGVQASQPEGRPAAPHEPRHAEREAVQAEADPVSGLHTILSSVAAEVDRLSSGKAQAGDTAQNLEAEHGLAEQKFAPSSESASSSRAARIQAVAPHQVEDALAATPLKPQSKPASAPPRPAPAARGGARPVWSARHLESEPAARQRSSTPGTAAPQKEPPARAKAMTGRDTLAEGIQMPVPESGPAMPPFQPAPFDEEEAAPPLSGSGDARPEIEQDKSFVGGMLNRVFAAQPKPAEEPVAEAPGIKGKAEKLARATIMDFAADKLGAPAFADALHADKPFMEAITDSLEHALVAGDAGMSKPGVANAAAPLELPGDELPEALIPPEPDDAGFDSALDLSHAVPMAAEPRIATPAVSAPEMRSAPAGDAPELGRAARHIASETRHAALRQSERAAKAEDETPPAAHQPAREETRLAPPSLPHALTAHLPSGLEDAIKELIKPLIVQWLNENLPRIVEKAVREEIAEQSLVSPQRSGVRR
jgi:hypothetical protein